MAFAVSNKMALLPRGADGKRMVAAKANTTKGTTSGRSTTSGRASGGAATINNVDFLKSLPGVSQPFPEVFDPANLSATASVKDIRRWRESELVHGRVAMLAALGFVVQENIEDNRAFFPFAGRITGPAIYHFQQVKQGFWEPLLILIGIAEAYRVTVGWAPPINGAEFNALREDYDMGDLGFDPLGLKPKDPEALKDLQTKELNNGRLAMIAVAGFVGQELLFQHEVLTWAGFNQALSEAPVDPKDVKPPPLPVQFPDKGLPNAKDIRFPNAGDVKGALKFTTSDNGLRLPTMTLPNFFSSTEHNSLFDIAAADDVPQPPALKVDNVKPPPIGLNFSGSPLGEAVNKASNAAPNVPNPLSGLNLPSGGELANKAQQAKNSLPGGLPSGGEVANKAQELKNNLPSLPNPLSGLINNAPSGGDLANKAQQAKNSLPGSLPSGGEIANKAQELKNNLPSLPNPLSGLSNISAPSGGEIANKAQEAKNSLPGGLPSGGQIANKAQELKNNLPSLPNPLSGLSKIGAPSGGEIANKAQEVKNSLPGGLPSGGEIANKAQELKNNLPSLPSFGGFKPQEAANNLPSGQDVANKAQQVKNNLPSFGGFKTSLANNLPSGGDVVNKAQQVKNSIPNPLSGLGFPSGGEIVNKAQQAKNSLPGGLPSGGEVANKAQELKNALPNPFGKTGLSDSINSVKNSLPSGQSVKNNLPNVRDIFSRVPDVPKPTVVAK